MLTIIPSKGQNHSDWRQSHFWNSELEPPEDAIPRGDNELARESDFVNIHLRVFGNSTQGRLRVEIYKRSIGAEELLSQ